MAPRFKTQDAFPPSGYYEYSEGGQTVSARTRTAIATLASDLRRRLGLPTVGDPFRYVMAYMCPRLPDGFCTERSDNTYIKAAEVRSATARLFGSKTVTTDEIERRLSICLRCPSHVTRGFCMGCSGLLEWVYKGFSGMRPKLPPDPATGVCRVSLELVAASATADLPKSDGYPDGCWRKAEVSNG